MPCEKYKPALIDAAVRSAELAPAIHAHVATCPWCAAELAQQRFLVGAIDTSLYRQMNVPVPAAMLERIEAHLAQRPQPNRLPRFAQIFTGTLATLAVAAAIVLLLPRHRQQIDQAKGILRKPTQDYVDQSHGVVNPPSKTVVSLNAQPKTANHARSRIVPVSTTAPRQEPEVLVPPDERVALNQLIADLSARHELVAALALREKPEQPVKQIEIPDIKTAALVIELIAEETRR
jgi:hypothetical protein